MTPRIAVVTGSRAEFGLLDPVIRANVEKQRENAAAEVEAGTFVKSSE